jgi:hypothetical protein
MLFIGTIYNLSNRSDRLSVELATFSNLLQSSTDTLVFSTNHIDRGYFVRVFFLDLVQGPQRIYAELICAAE